MNEIDNKKMETTNKREIIVFENNGIYLLEVQLENLNNKK
jgi:hypothetical protein